MRKTYNNFLLKKTVKKLRHGKGSETDKKV